MPIEDSETQRAFVKVMAKLGKGPTEIYNMLHKAYGETSLSLSSVKKWRVEYGKGVSAEEDATVCAIQRQNVRESNFFALPPASFRAAQGNKGSGTKIATNIGKATAVQAKRIVDAARKNPGMSSVQLAKMLSIPSTNVTAVLRQPLVYGGVGTSRSPVFKSLFRPHVSGPKATDVSGSVKFSDNIEDGINFPADHDSDAVDAVSDDGAMEQDEEQSEQFPVRTLPSNLYDERH